MAYEPPNEEARIDYERRVARMTSQGHMSREEAEKRAAIITAALYGRRRDHGIQAPKA